MDIRRSYTVSLYLNHDAIKDGLTPSHALRDALRDELARLDPGLEVHCHHVHWRGRRLAVTSRWTKDRSRLVIEIGLWPAGVRPLTIIAGPPRTKT
jgi:hypothetical protein